MYTCIYIYIMLYMYIMYYIYVWIDVFFVCTKEYQLRSGYGEQGYSSDSSSSQCEPPKFECTPLSQDDWVSQSSTSHSGPANLGWCDPPGQTAPYVHTWKIRNLILIWNRWIICLINRPRNKLMLLRKTSELRNRLPSARQISGRTFITHGCTSF